MAKKRRLDRTEFRIIGDFSVAGYKFLF